MTSLQHVFFFTNQIDTLQLWIIGELGTSGTRLVTATRRRPFSSWKKRNKKCWHEKSRQFPKIKHTIAHAVLHPKSILKVTQAKKGCKNTYIVRFVITVQGLVYGHNNPLGMLEWFLSFSSVLSTCQVCTRAKWRTLIRFP